jgi:hypothetical protein
MDDVKPVAGHSSAAVAHPDDTTPEGLAMRFFVLTMAGVVLYISAILWLLSSG